MAVTLAEAKNNAQTDLDVAVIDEFRKESVILDAIPFDQAVNPAGGGATLLYGYRRQITQRGAAFRAVNTEYTPAEVTTQQFSTELKPLGGSFQVDRVLAPVGPAASGAVSLNLREVIKATRTKFQDEVINGDTGVDANGFDGLDKALTGSSTEMSAAAVINWSDWDTDPTMVHKALDKIDEWLSLLDGPPDLILGNSRALARVRAAARRAGAYVQSPVEGLIGQNGRPIIRESYGSIVFADPGEKAGTNNPIIPVETRTVGVSTPNLTDLYAIRFGLDGFHAVATAGGQIVQTWLPDFTTAGAVKTGEVEMGPVSVALKRTKAAAVLRNIKVA